MGKLVQVLSARVRVRDIYWLEKIIWRKKYNNFWWFEVICSGHFHTRRECQPWIVITVKLSGCKGVHEIRDISGQAIFLWSKTSCISIWSYWESLFTPHTMIKNNPVYEFEMIHGFCFSVCELYLLKDPQIFSANSAELDVSIYHSQGGGPRVDTR